MKTISTLTICLLLLFSNNLFAAEKNSLSDASAIFRPGVLVCAVKPEYRSACLQESIKIAEVEKILAEAGTATARKKFPLAKTPSEAAGKVDLSLVYEIRFPLSVSVDKMVALLSVTKAFRYVEPLFVQTTDFTPNDPQAPSQYHLNKIKALQAWDVLKGDTNVVIGIVDSGTDWDHPDLAGNIKYNYADPVDGIDNENDGFVDNFRGWDVSENDNDPMVVASSHGSHVSGCAAAVTDNNNGVASPGFNCKFLPVKSSLDGSSSSIDNGYDGIVYAVDHGADIVNCSWGRTGLPSIFEQEIIDYAAEKNVLVVAAAGNNGLDEVHFPSSYDNAFSVASTGPSDVRSSFSNYNLNVDIAAPGSDILSTIFDDSYSPLSGTSMASPVAAGCAAMVKSKFPSLTARQIAEQLRTTSDNIYSVPGNLAYRGKLGKGRVNLFQAVSDSVSPGVIVKSYTVTDGNDDVFVIGDTLSVVVLFENLLRPTTNLVCTLTASSSMVQVLQGTFNAGIINSLDTVSNFAAEYKVLVKPNAQLNSQIEFPLFLNDGSWSDLYIIKITVNVDYINVAVNDVATSITSKGLIGYNQQQQTQGLGFTYQGSNSLLYDMSLMVSAQGRQVSDNARAMGANDADFASLVNVSAQEPGIVSDFDVKGSFSDNGTTSTSPLHIEINQHAYAWINAPDNKYIMVQYFIHNNDAATLNNLRAGLFADWDIVPYDSNKCATDAARKMGYVYCTVNNGLYAGIKLLSHNTFNHYGADNISSSGINLADGFSEAEKWTTLSTSRTDAGTASAGGNDVLSCVSGGGDDVAPGDSMEVAFALIAGDNLSDIQASADAAQAMYDDDIFNSISEIPQSGGAFLGSAYPNPANDHFTVSFRVDRNGPATLEILDITGKIIAAPVNESLTAGNYSQRIESKNIPAGLYYYRLTGNNLSVTKLISIIRN